MSVRWPTAARRTASAPAPRGRPRWWAELLLIAVLYEAYTMSRLVVAGDPGTAMRNADRILRVESITGLDPERLLNTVVSAHTFFAVACDYAYATLHYLVTPLVLFWLWRWRPAHYRRARTTLAIATIAALAGFMLFPTAPPRMVGGFTDTMASFSDWGWWGTDASAPRGLGHLTNEYAAMPSLHVGWAAWCGWQLWRHGRGRLTRAAGALYAPLVILVVIGTANHYLADVAAGLAVVGLAALASPWLLRALDRRREKAGTPGPAPADEPPERSSSANILPPGQTGWASGENVGQVPVGSGGDRIPSGPGKVPSGWYGAGAVARRVPAPRVTPKERAP